MPHTEQSAPKVTDVPFKKRSANSSSTQSSKRNRENISTTNNRSEEAYQILKDTVASRPIRDDSTVFGEHVGAKHRKYSRHTQCIVEHHISNILFNADMGRYEPQVPRTLPPGHIVHYNEQQVALSVSPITSPQHSSSTHSQGRNSLYSMSDNPPSTPQSVFQVQVASPENETENASDIQHQESIVNYLNTYEPYQ